MSQPHARLRAAALFAITSLLSAFGHAQTCSYVFPHGTIAVAEGCGTYANPCAPGSPMTLSVQPLAGQPAFQSCSNVTWMFGDSTILKNTTIDPVTHTYTNASFYNASALVGNSDGSVTYEATLWVANGYFHADSSAVSDGPATAQLQVTRTSGAGTATISYSTKDGTAKAGINYTPESGTVTFAPGETTKSIDIPILDGNVTIGTSAVFYINLSPQPGWLFSNLDPPSPTYPMVINGDDPPPPSAVFSFSSAHYSVLENAGTATITVNRTGGMNATSVHWTASSGTGGTLNFAANQTSQTAVVPVADDDFWEGNRDVTLSLYADSPATVDPSANRATLTIIDDEPKPQLVVDDLSVPEGNSGTTKVAFNVHLNGKFGTAVSFHPDLQQGTAQVWTDYNIDPAGFPSILTFNSGDTLKSLTCVINGNTNVEPDKTFTVQLTALNALAPVMTKPVATCTILNDDHAIVPSSIAIADGSTATLQLAIGQPLQTASSFTLTSSNPQVASVPATIAIPAGSANIAIPVAAHASGSATITAALPPPLGNDVLHAGITVSDAPMLVFSAPSVSLATGTSSSIAIGFQPSSGTPQTVSLSVADPTIASVPGSVVVQPGAQMSFEIDGFRPGTTLLTAAAASGGSTSVTIEVTDALHTLTVTAVAPSSGTTAGGTLVRISGDAFTGQCWPFFGSAAAHLANVTNATDMIATSPAHAAGPVDITVRCGSTAQAGLGSGFTFVSAGDAAPFVTSVNPQSAAPGQSVTIGGMHFRTNDVVAFDGTRARAMASAPDQHVVMVPEIPPGTVSISVTDASGRTTNTGPIFTVVAPLDTQIADLAPRRVADGGELTITGSGFRPSVGFQLDSIPLATLSLSATHAVVRVPMGTPPGAYTLRAGNAVGPVISVGTAPVITTVTPLCTTTSGGATIIISGSGFQQGATVTIGGHQATAVSVQPNRMSVVAPSNDAGATVVAVANPDGSTATFSAGFRVVSPYDPDGCAPRLHAAPH